MNFVIIGAGPAGVRAAETLRENDSLATVTLVGAEPGTILVLWQPAVEIVHRSRRRQRPEGASSKSTNFFSYRHSHSVRPAPDLRIDAIRNRGEAP